MKKLTFKDNFFQSTGNNSLLGANDNQDFLCELDIVTIKSIFFLF